MHTGNLNHPGCFRSVSRSCQMPWLVLKCPNLLPLQQSRMRRQPNTVLLTTLVVGPPSPGQDRGASGSSFLANGGMLWGSMSGGKRSWPTGLHCTELLFELVLGCPEVALDILAALSRKPWVPQGCMSRVTRNPGVPPPRADGCGEKHPPSPISTFCD